MMRGSYVVALVGLVSVAACGGSGGGGGGGAPSGQVEAYALEGLRLAQEVEGLSATSPNLIPRSNSATYNGVFVTSFVGGSLGGVEALAGDANVTVNFATNQVSGGVTGIVDQDNRSFGNGLSISGGRLNRSGSLNGIVTGNLDGTLVSPGTAPLTIDGDLAGAFAGPNAGYFAGVVTGSAQQGSSQRTLDDGGIIGQR